MAARPSTNKKEEQGNALVHPDILGNASLNIYEHDPCLLRGVKQGTSGFLLGSMAGGVVTYLKDHGGKKWGLREVLQSVGKFGGAFALAGATWSVSECAFQELRNIKDPWNSILGAATAGFLLGASVKKSIFASVLTSALAGGSMLVAEMVPISPSVKRTQALSEQRLQRLASLRQESRSRREEWDEEKEEEWKDKETREKD